MKGGATLALYRRVETAALSTTRNDTMRIDGQRETGAAS